jgi:hypothetical protein
VFIIYDSNKTNASAIRKAHNDMHPAIQYKYEEEQNNKISFLDLEMHKKECYISIGIHRKPTFTDTMIPSESNHPDEHKFAGFKYMLDRVNRLPLEQEERSKESKIIAALAKNNGYDIKTIE